MLTHGTLATYKNHRCRCDLCREANRKWVHQCRNPVEHVTDKIGTSWMTQGSCRDYPTDWWFEGKPTDKTWKRAMEICADCPVRTKCLEWALQWPVHDLHGIWGGTSQRERVRITEQRKAPTCPVPTTLRTVGRLSGTTSPKR